MRPLPRCTVFPYTTLFRSQFDSINELEETKLVNDDDTTKHNSPVTDSKKKPKMKRWKKILIVFLIIALVVGAGISARSEEHTSELQSRGHLVCRLLLEKRKKDAQQ